MFGVSFLEIALVALVALVVVGPQKLPGMMRTAGEWVGKLRRITADMRAQTGIDDILREEGIDGVAELRTLLKGERAMAARRSAPAQRGYEAYNSEPDPAVEFPVEGPDALGALPDDLLEEDSPPADATSPSETPEPIALTTKPASSKAVAAVESSASEAQPAAAEDPPAPEPAPESPPASKRPPPPSRRPVPPKSSPSTSSPPRSSRGPLPRPRPITGSAAAPGALPSSIPPPPVTPRHSPPRAVTHSETPRSKVPRPAAPKVTISQPSPESSPEISPKKSETES